MLPFPLKSDCQYSNMSAEAGMGWIGQGSCQGSSKVSGISGISNASPLTSEAIWITEFSDRRRSVNSEAWALSTLFSEANLRYSWEAPSIISLIFLFSCWILFSCAISSSKCCCFLIRDLRADSRFESLRFLFLSSISEPGLDGCCFEAIAQNWMDKIWFDI